MRILSFDSATENLGVCVINYDEQWDEKIKLIIQRLYDFYDELNINSDWKQTLRCILYDANNILESVISIEYAQAINCTNGKKVTDMTAIERTINLKKYLTGPDFKPDFKPDVVLIEHQMKPNDISRINSMQIAYHFADICPVYIVDPGCKNKYSFSNDTRYETFITRYTNYTSNKKHTDANMKYFVKLMNSNMLDNIAKGQKTNDIADAFMQAVAWLKNKNLI